MIDNERIAKDLVAERYARTWAENKDSGFIYISTTTKDIQPIDLSNLSQLLALANYHQITVDYQGRWCQACIWVVNKQCKKSKVYKASEPRANERAIREVIEMIYTTKQGEDNE